MSTISTHNGSSAHRDHNIRNEKVVSKEAHIDPNGTYEIWKDETPRQAYHKLFDKSVKEYNDKQTREDRKIKNYYSQIEKDAKKHPVYEMIIGIYPSNEENISQETQREIMKEFVDTWQERNPNLYMCGAYFHADEEGEPHCHIDYIPIAHNYKNGMETQTGLVKALGEQGFEKKGKLTAQIQWEQQENKYLEKLCNDRGIEISHPKQEGREHLDTETYKAQKSLESSLEHTRDLLDIQDQIRGETSELEAKRDKVEGQFEKALKRKVKAFDKSYKKDKESGWVYDKTLKKEIEELAKEVHEDVKAISHTNLDVEREYDIARHTREEAQEEARTLKLKAESELKKAKEYRENQESYIRGTSEKIAKDMFQDFLKNEFYTRSKRDRDNRLEEFCSDIKFNDGSTVLERFEESEKELKKQLKKEWDRQWER